MVKLNRFFESLLEGLHAEQVFHGTVWKEGIKLYLQTNTKLITKNFHSHAFPLARAKKVVAEKI
jgi:hypothetical protein